MYDMKRKLLAIGCWLLTWTAGAQSITSDSLIRMQLQDYGLTSSADNSITLLMS